LWKWFRPELVEDGVEDERAPADEEDGGDAAEEDVSSSSALINLRMLTGRSRNDDNKFLGLLVQWKPVNVIIGFYSRLLKK
jgi:hypothetical protein